MSDGNPYQASAPALGETSPVPASAESRQYAQVEPTTIHYAQLGLRLIGVMFAGEGLCGLIGSLVYMGMQAALVRRAGYQAVPDAYVIGWFAASAATFLVGCYFVVSGRWVLEMVFVSQPAREAESSDE